MKSNVRENVASVVASRITRLQDATGEGAEGEGIEAGAEGAEGAPAAEGAPTAEGGESGGDDNEDKKSK